MAIAQLVELRLTRFKSHQEQRLRFEPLTLVIGRNGSGKSNVLDALGLLALLADERDVNDLERGDQEVAGLRGGISGAAPFGSPNVEVGCSIEFSPNEQLSLDVTLEASEHPEIVSERLVLKHKNRSDKILIDAKRRSPGAGISDVAVYSGGAPRSYQLLSTRLATAQSLTKVPVDTKARTLVVDCCGQLVAALRGVFVLDPVPGSMREYVRIGSPPNRSGSATSALVFRLRESAEAWERLNSLVRDLVEVEVDELTFSQARLPDDRLVDVMVALIERVGETTFTVPARLMSDGTLRYLAIVAALLDLGRENATYPASAGRALVVEEIENGLFPSQADHVLSLLRTEAKARGARLIATTHSPALLDALQPDDHAGVVICDRPGGGRGSRLRRLIDHPRYLEIAGAGAVGQAVTRGYLSDATQTTAKVSELFAS